MKVRNFAFFGVMAAILSVSAANADTTKRIASTNYVDNKIVNDTTNTGTISSSSTTTAPSEKTVYDAIQSARGDTTALANRVTTAEGNITSLQSGKQDKSDSTVANGTYNIITQGTGVGANLTALDSAIGAVPANSTVMAEIAAAQQAAGTIAERTENATANQVVTGVTTENGSVKSVSSSAVSQAMLDTTLGNKVTSYDTHIADTDIHVTTADKTTWNAKQDALTFDSTPTTNSTNPVTSGGVAAAIAAAQSAATYDDAALVGRVTTAENDIDALESDMTDAQANIATLQSDKQDKVTTAVENNIATWNAAGQTKDSGRTFTLTVDASSTDAQIPTAAAVQTAISGAAANVTYPSVNVTGANALANIDGTAAANQDTHCSANEPCVLTYEGNGAYKWSSIWGLPTNN